jgi:ADP-ribose pyrophosphatase YjhB (NUDIX family)
MINQAISLSSLPPVFNRGNHVLIALFDQHNRLFLARKNIYPDKIYRLLGGGVDKGESPDEASERELTEETQLKMPLTLMESFSFIISVPKQDDIYFAAHLYTAHIDKETPKPADDVDAIKAFSLPDFIALTKRYSELSKDLIIQNPTLSGTWYDWGKVFGFVNTWLINQWPAH